MRLEGRSWQFIFCIGFLLSIEGTGQTLSEPDCPDKVLVGALTGLVANDEILTEVESDIQLLVDCLEDGEVLFLNTTSTIQPKSTVKLDKRVTVSGLDPVIERRLVRNANKGVGDVPAGRTGARITCPEDKELFIMSNQASLANLIIQNCKLGSNPLKQISSPYKKNAIKEAVVVVRGCKGEGKAGVFACSFQKNENQGQASSMVVYEGCTAELDGVEMLSNAGIAGALVVYGKAELSHVSFESNAFVARPDVNPSSALGAGVLCSGGSLVIKKSIFTGNQGATGGAIAVSGCTATMESSTFTKNSANFFGGAVGITGEPSNVTITSSNFESNAATGKGSRGGAIGCVAGSRVRISGGTFLGNKAGLMGGALGMQKCKGGQDISTGDLRLIGEGLRRGNLEETCFRGQLLDMQDLRFLANSAGSKGGAVSIGEYWGVDGRGLVFKGNQAVSGGAVDLGSKVTATFLNADFEDNFAHFNGGGIDVNDGNLIISGGRFVNNSASSGGAIMGDTDYFPRGQITLTNVEFKANVARDLNGGAIVLLSNHVLTIENCTFVANKASMGGGAITIFGDKPGNFSQITMKKVSAKKNVASGGPGGFMGAEFIELNVADSRFSDNSCELFGGVFHLSQVNRATVADSNFVGNSVFGGFGAQGGAIEIDQLRRHLDDVSGHVQLKGCDFFNNSADFGQGAVTLNDVKIAEVTGCTFRQNTAPKFASAFSNVIKFVDKPSFRMIDCKFVENQGPLGAILLSYPIACNCADHIIERTAFTSNREGYGLVIAASVLPRVELDDPNADLSEPGGARFIQASGLRKMRPTSDKDSDEAYSGIELAIRSTQFANNTGGIQLLPMRRFLPIRIEDSQFMGNTLIDSFGFEAVTALVARGAGIFLHNPRAELKNCIFIGNSVVGAANGGGIGMRSTTKGGYFSCNNCTFTENSAANGGAVAIDLEEETIVRFSKTTFDSNHAERGFGGGFYSRIPFSDDSIQFHCGRSSETLSEMEWFPLQHSLGGNCSGIAWKGNTARIWGDDAGGPPQAVKLNATFIENHRSQSRLPPISVHLMDGAGVIVNTEILFENLTTSLLPNLSGPLLQVSVVDGPGSVNLQVLDRMGLELELVLNNVEVSAAVTSKPVNITLQVDVDLTNDNNGLFSLAEKQGLGVFPLWPAQLVVQVQGCRVGELSVGDTCRECQAGTFSMSSNRQFCDPCPYGGICRMGVLVPQNEYWMLDPWGHDVVKCRNNKACQTELSLLQNVATREDALLDFHRANPVVDDQFPAEDFTVCAPGYEGLLCGSCSEGFGRSGVECSECHSKGATAGLVVLTHTIPLILIGILTLLAIMKMHRSEGPLAEGAESLSTPIVLMIGVNYFQIMSTAQFLEAEWPFSLERLFAVQGAVGSVGLASFGNMECLMDGSSVPRSLQRVIIESLFPFMVALVACLLWQFVALTKKIPWQRLKIYMLITTFYVLTQLYTSANTAILSLFSCFDLSTSSELGSIQGEFWTEDSNVRCYRGEHLVAVIFVGVAGMLLVSFGVPILVLAFLWVRRAELFSREHAQKYGFLYLPYKPKSYFWASVITLRKALVVIVVVFTGGFGPQLQTQLFGFVLFSALLLQLAIQPFQSQRHNLLETTSLLVSWGTLFFGLYIFGGEGRIVRVSTHTRDVLTLIVLIINVALSFWFVLELVLGAKGDASKKELGKKLKSFWNKRVQKGIVQ